VNRLHIFKKDGKIKGFILPYLGQRDQALPIQPSDLIRREEVIDYPTNFAAMSPNNIRILSKRGEQLTDLLLSAYWS
jgi:NTE family protein